MPSDLHSVTLADRVFRFQASPQAPLLPELYTPFLSTHELQAHGGEYQVVETLPPIVVAAEDVWTGSTWRMRGTGQAFQVDLQDALTESWHSAAVFSTDFSEGSLLPLIGRCPEKSFHALNYPLDQILFVNRLTRTGAVLLHASGVLHEGRIRLFCGRSDIGKTTMARFWRESGATLLNDDRMLLWERAGQIVAGPAPWHGEDPEINNLTAPLAGIYHLRQTPFHQVIPLDPVSGSAALAATAVLPFYFKSAVECGMQILEKTAEQIPSFRLGFRRSPDIVDLILNQNR